MAHYKVIHEKNDKSHGQVFVHIDPKISSLIDSWEPTYYGC